MTYPKMLSPKTISPRLLAFSLVSLCTGAALTGCGISNGLPGKNSAPVAPAPASAGKGVFMGGQQPVANVALQLYAVGTTGYGSAATPLLPPNTVFTRPSGNFTIPAFTCPSPSALVYLVGIGGQPIAATGSAPAVTNNNLAMMVGLGPCSTVGSNFISANELTTVATVYALSSFMTGVTNIGAPPTNMVGLTNAFAAINKLVNTTNGQVSGPALPAGATLPISKLNTLADIVAQCVNSAGGSASDTTDGQTDGTGCGRLFFLTEAATTPADTITAVMNLAQNPGTNVAKLNMLRSTSPAFSPTLSVNTPPTDFTIGINYVGGGMSAAKGVAMDAAGNVWTVNSNNSVSKFDPSGAPLSPAGGFTAGGAFNTPTAIAIDPSGNAWIANSGNNTLVMLDPTGANATVYSGNGLNTPVSVAIDGSGDVSVANAGGGISIFTAAGSPGIGSPYLGNGLNGPTSIAISPK
jgi:hypothetical protein